MLTSFDHIIPCSQQAEEMSIEESNHNPKLLKGKPERQEDATYFNYYGMLVNQQNMLQDLVRTNAYHQAVLGNREFFRGKVVLDVGAGTGILSFFAAQAGASRVYAVEASAMVIRGKIEDIELPEPVDLIISEPMGVLLLHERMIESFIIARDRFLKPDTGLLLPDLGTIFLSPFTDSLGYAEILGRARFWEHQNFMGTEDGPNASGCGGVNLSALASVAKQHYFGQPCVGAFDPKTLMTPSPALSLDLNFMHCSVQDLKHIERSFSFVSAYTGLMHGMAGWFDVQFFSPRNSTSITSSTTITLNTGPHCERTHWQQVRFYFEQPIALNQGQVVNCHLTLTANAQRSYNMTLELLQTSTPINNNESNNSESHQFTHRFSYALQDQHYNYNAPFYSDSEFKPEFIGLYQKSI